MKAILTISLLMTLVVLAGACAPASADGQRLTPTIHDPALDRKQQETGQTADQEERKKNNTSSGRGCLPGKWELDNTSMAKAIIESLKKNDSGTQFTLDDIRGAYLATINLNSSKVRVNWQDWEMRGTAKTKRAGTFKVLVRLDGMQDYKILHVTAKQMGVKLKRNAVNVSVTFAGKTVPDAKMDIPTMATGKWTCNVDDFTLANKGFKWNFERAH